MKTLITIVLATVLLNSQAWAGLGFGSTLSCRDTTSGIINLNVQAASIHSMEDGRNGISGHPNYITHAGFDVRQPSSAGVDKSHFHSTCYGSTAAMIAGNEFICSGTKGLLQPKDTANMEYLQTLVPSLKFEVQTVADKPTLVYSYKITTVRGAFYSFGSVPCELEETFKKIKEAGILTVRQ